MQRTRFLTLIACQMLSVVGIALLSMVAACADDDDEAFLPRLVVSSTIPGNGDLNPYGVAFVPYNFPKGGSIVPGDVLISNSMEPSRHRLRPAPAAMRSRSLPASSPASARRSAYCEVGLSLSAMCRR
jgi:hypothetical protein